MNSMDAAFKATLRWMADVPLKVTCWFDYGTRSETGNPSRFIEPVAEEKIARVEEIIGCRFPLAYRRYLANLGGGGYCAHYGGSFPPHKDANQIVDTQKAISKTLRENIRRFYSSGTLEHIWVLYDHGTAWGLFFSLNEGDNPPLYSLGDGKGDLSIAAKNLMHFLLKDLRYTVVRDWDDQHKRHPAPPLLEHYLGPELADLYEIYGI